MVFENFRHDFAGIGIVRHGAQRHAQHGGFSLATIAILTLPVLTALSGPVGLEFKIDEVVRVVVTTQDPVPPLATVTAVRTPPRLVFFTAKAGATAPAITR